MTQVLDPLQQLNAIIGLCFRMPKWPSALHAVGYRVDRVEPKFVDHSNNTINPEAFLFSSRQNSLLIVECKSGKSLAGEDIRQLTNFLALDAEDLVRRAAVPSLNKDTLVWDVVLVINEESATAIMSNLDDAAIKLPVLAMSLDGLRVISGHFKDIATDSALRTCETSHEFAPPVSFVPLLASATRASIAEHVTAAVVEMMSTDVRQFSIHSLMEKIFLFGLWPTLDNEAQKAIRTKTQDILKEIERTELRDYVRRRGDRGSNPPVWVLRDSPADADPKVQTLKWQALERTRRAYLERLATGTKFKGFVPEQDDFLGSVPQ